MWSQCEHNHISWPFSLRARVRTTRVERHIGQSSEDAGICSNAVLVRRHTGQNAGSLSELLVAAESWVAIPDVFSVVPHNEHFRNVEFEFVEMTCVESIRSKVYTLKYSTRWNTENPNFHGPCSPYADDADSPSRYD